jgi:DNA-binding Lrp family transcriptional regulator
MTKILDYLKKHGERSDADIAAATGISLAELQRNLTELKAKNQIMLCESIKYVKGNEVKATLCRVSGYIPPAAPGRKSAKVQITI